MGSLWRIPRRILLGTKSILIDRFEGWQRPGAQKAILADRCDGLGSLELRNMVCYGV